ncbi:rap guanine nucleotide exchange factor 1-like isoform X1 [Mytilus californianus]|uniref:rap guanine nucleotide exchange factor 1-like isoform X1 n=2 Tax=Mytilus californianus TaxID=6549 RepID=UPI0022475369|nr:rap guanine nucleotide exchange factor 1-like isoform X1 [Mytilus californianus]
MDTTHTAIPEKTSGSKMLKKAKSFRDDVKNKLKRRPSSSAADHSMTEIREYSRSNSRQNSRQSSRQNSRNNSVSKEDGGSSRLSSPLKQIKPDRQSVFVKDVDKLQEEVNKVYRSLNYIKAVVDNEKLQVIPTTATVVLETVMDVFNLLSHFFMTKDTNTLPSIHKKVCQCLALFIRWADKILLNGGELLNKGEAHEVIKALTDGVEELKQTSIDKLEDRKNNVSPPKSPDPLQRNDGQKRASLPDIPLTPREKKILDDTSGMGLYDNAHLHGSQSSDSIMHHSRDPTGELPPPPKPPLPSDTAAVHRIVKTRSKSASDDLENGNEPPPLPEKEKRPSLVNSQDFFTSTPNAKSSLSLSGYSTPSNQSPHNSLIIQNDSFNSLMDCSSSPLSVSPLSRSPNSSMSSGLNRSSEDLLDSANLRVRTDSFSRVHSESGIGLMKKLTTSLTKSASQSDGTIGQVNELTLKIDELTKGIAKLTNQNGENNLPPLPVKRSKPQRQASMYDNVTDSGINLSRMEARMSSSSTSSSQSFSGFSISQKTTSVSYSHRTSSQETCSSSEAFSSTSHSSIDSLPKPPPLPPKKKHIQEYMRTFGSYSQPSATISDCIYSRHSMNFYESQWHETQIEIQSPYPRSNTISLLSDLSSDSSISGSGLAIPPLPTKRKYSENRDSMSSIQSDTSLEYPREKAASMVEGPTQGATGDIELKRSSCPPGHLKDKMEATLSSLHKPEMPRDADSDFAEINPLDDIDVSDQLVRKKDSEDGPEIRGGSVDAMIVHASAVNRNGSESESVNQEDFLFQEAFLTTYRTFITPTELMDKLLYRFQKFHHAPDKKKKVAGNGFALLIRIIDEVRANELAENTTKKIMDLVFELLCQGDLMLAKILRKKIIEKCESKQTTADIFPSMTIMSSISLQTSPSDMLHVKSHDIAEQMTLLDAELFQKIEIPEVLLWAKEQSEEQSPNLTTFTEHFNKMSYWVRTRILTQEEAKDREKYFMKFIKVMRHLRKLNNFNSYLAILSAVDSAPIRRLEWQRPNLEVLKEFCQLIDSSGSFRAYRHALAETEPPCIPYIGLILQDLTFINIGNQDFLPDGNINFAKRWQQFHILDSMRRFKKDKYEMKKSERILSVFNNFDDCLSEESLWQISEKIKPRGKKKEFKPES